MNIKRRDFIRAGGMLAIAGGGAAVADAAGVPAEAPAGAVRFSQDVPVLGDYDVCVVGAVPYAGLRKRLEGQNHFFA